MEGEARSRYGSGVNDPERDTWQQALSVVAKARSAEAVRAALDTLPRAIHKSEKRSSPATSGSLPPRGRSDADCALRVALLRGLRSCAVRADPSTPR